MFSKRRGKWPARRTSLHLLKVLQEPHKYRVSIEWTVEIINGDINIKLDLCLNSIYLLHQWFLTFFAGRTPKIKHGLLGPLNCPNWHYKNVIYDIELHFYDLHGPLDPLHGLLGGIWTLVKNLCYTLLILTTFEVKYSARESLDNKLSNYVWKNKLLMPLRFCHFLAGCSIC